MPCVPFKGKDGASRRCDAGAYGIHNIPNNGGVSCGGHVQSRDDIEQKVGDVEQNEEAKCAF